MGIKINLAVGLMFHMYFVVCTQNHQFHFNNRNLNDPDSIQDNYKYILEMHPKDTDTRDNLNQMSKAIFF